ncbi:MAG: glycosyltransferase family 2 protein, partial [Methanobacterium sp.]|nr:glycosyltransferase family 2 protein [Methanobacterium sp.]
MKPNVSIIILNWNGWEDTIECLESLYQIDYPNYNVIVVDNGSEDDSIEKIKEYCTGKIKVSSDFFEYDATNKPIKIVEITKKESELFSKINGKFKKLILIKNDQNYGFAEGNNIGIRFALSYLNTDYVLLLNNDTIVDRNFLSELVDIEENENNVGILGPTIFYYNDKNRIQSAGVKISWKKGIAISLKRNKIFKDESNNINDVDAVSGCCLLAKSELFKKIGFLNSKYFLYWEETEWCIRTQKLGYRIIHVPNAKIWHKVSATTNKSRGVYEFYMIRNMIWFMKEHAQNIHFLIFSIYLLIFRFWFISGSYIIHN